MSRFALSARVVLGRCRFLLRHACPSTSCERNYNTHKGTARRLCRLCSFDGSGIHRFAFRLCSRRNRRRGVHRASASNTLHRIRAAQRRAAIPHGRVKVLLYCANRRPSVAPPPSPTAVTIGHHGSRPGREAALASRSWHFRQPFFHRHVLESSRLDMPPSSAGKLMSTARDRSFLHPTLFVWLNLYRG